MNKVGGHINHIKNIVDAFIPSFKEEAFVFNWSEVHNTIDSIDSAADQFEVVQLAKLLFAKVLVNSYKLADSVEGETAIILRDDSEVVLNKHSVELLAVGLELG